MNDPINILIALLAIIFGIMWCVLVPIWIYIIRRNSTESLRYIRQLANTVWKK